MSNTPIKTAEEILDSIPDDPNQDGVCYTLNETLAAVYAYHSQFEGRGEGVRELMISFANLPYSNDYDAGVREGYNDCIDKVRAAAREVLAESPLPSTKGEDSELQMYRKAGILDSPILQEQAQAYAENDLPDEAKAIKGLVPYGAIEIRTQAFLAGHAQASGELLTKLHETSKKYDMEAVDNHVLRARIKELEAKLKDK